MSYFLIRENLRNKEFSPLLKAIGESFSNKQRHYAPAQLAPSGVFEGQQCAPQYQAGYEPRILKQGYVFLYLAQD